MKKFNRYGAAVITAVSLAWPIVAVWLSARGVIRYETERWTSLLCLIGALSGPVLHWNQSKSQKFLALLLATFVPLCALAAILIVRRHSSAMFAHWVIRAIPKSTWQQMITDLNAFAAGAVSREESFVPAKALPGALTRLAHREDLIGADAIVRYPNGAVGARLCVWEPLSPLGIDGWPSRVFQPP